MNYETLVRSIANLHADSVGRAATAVNQALVLRNWLIGAYLIEFEQNGEDRAAYGEKLLPSLARDLGSRGIPGASRQMLDRMRSFCRAYPHLGSHIRSLAMSILPLPDSILRTEICSSPMSKSPTPLAPVHILRFSWTHLIELLRLDDPWKCAFYENECLRGNWSVRQLQRQIGSLLYERTALSTDKEGIIEAGRAQAKENPSTLAGLIRDPYVLEFAGLAERPHYRESELEAALLDHLQSFLLELGAGFCFEARQKRITVGNEHDYIDLVTGCGSRGRRVNRSRLPAALSLPSSV